MRWNDKRVVSLLSTNEKIQSKYKFECISFNSTIRIRSVKQCKCNFIQHAFGAIDMSDGANVCANEQCTSTNPVSQISSGNEKYNQIAQLFVFAFEF